MVQQISGPASLNCALQQPWVPVWRLRQAMQGLNIDPDPPPIVPLNLERMSYETMEIRSTVA